MENIYLEQQLSEIHQKLDSITEYIQIERRRQQEMRELKDDLALIGKDAFQAAVVELEEVAGHFNTSDLLFLIKKLLRNTRHLNKMLDQVDGTAGLFEDIKPLGKQIFNEILETLDELDRKGYFTFLKEMFGVLDRIITTFSEEDMVRLKDNIPVLATKASEAMALFEKMDAIVERDISFRALYRELKDPEVRRGIAVLLQFARIAGRPRTNGSKRIETNQKEI